MVDAAETPRPKAKPKKKPAPVSTRVLICEHLPELFAGTGAILILVCATVATVLGHLSGEALVGILSAAGGGGVGYGIGKAK